MVSSARAAADAHRSSIFSPIVPFLHYYACTTMVSHLNCILHLFTALWPLTDRSQFLLHGSAHSDVHVDMLLASRAHPNPPREAMVGERDDL